MNKTPLYLVVLIPILLIVVIAIGVVIQQQRYEPSQEFVYSVTSYMYGSCEKFISAAVLNKPAPALTPFEKNAPPVDCTNKVALYVYNFQTKTSRPVTVEAARALGLIDRVYSSDGFFIMPNCLTQSIWPLSLDHGRDVCVVLKHYQKSLDIDHDRNSYVTFIAWVQRKN